MTSKGLLAKGSIDEMSRATMTIAKGSIDEMSRATRRLVGLCLPL